jgi:hypothetical protein
LSDDEDSAEIDYAVSKLIKGRPDPDKSDDKYMLRILQHPSILPTHVYTLLSLLYRRRGGTVPDIDNTDDDQALLARAVTHLSGSPTYGLHQSMMCFTGLFASGNVELSDRLIGVRDAATALLDAGGDAKKVSVDLVQRVGVLAGEAREEVSNALGGVIERMLQDMVAIGGWASTESALALEESTSAVPLTDEMTISDIFARTGLTARQFVWTYRAVEKHVRLMDMARELGAKIQKTLDELSALSCWEETEEYKQFLIARRELGAFISRERSALGSGEWDEEDLEECERLLREADRVLQKRKKLEGTSKSAAASEPTAEAGGGDLRAEDDSADGDSGGLQQQVESVREVLVGDAGVTGSAAEDDGEGDAGGDVVMAAAHTAEDTLSFTDDWGDVDDFPFPMMDEGWDADGTTTGEEQAELVPITQDELDDILRERYRWNRSHKPGKDGKDSYGKELAKDSKAHPGWKDAARQARDTWVKLEKALPGTYCLWKLGDTIGELVLRFNQKGSSKWSADTVYKNISAFLNSNLTYAEKAKYFGSVQTFKDCSLILKTAWKGVKKALADTLKNAEYSEKERHVPMWPVLFDLARTYVNETAAPLRIETAEQAKLVRRLYGLRVTITEHVPRRREVFKVTPLRLTHLDPSHEGYVDPRKCNYVDDSGVLRLNVYKTADVYGEYALQLTPEAHNLIVLLEDYAERENQKTLFGSENNLSNLLYDIYEPVLHVRVGCGALRRRYISNAVREGRLRRQRDQIELSRKMGHSVWMQLFYYAKDEVGTVGASIPNIGSTAPANDPPTTNTSASTQAAAPSGHASEPIVLDSDTEDITPASPPGRKRPGNTDQSPPTKRMKERHFRNPLQTAALREIIQKERAEGGAGNKIAWNTYVALYPVLQDVDGDTIRRWGNRVRDEMDGKKPSPSRGKGKEAASEDADVE